MSGYLRFCLSRDELFRVLKKNDSVVGGVSAFFRTNSTSKTFATPDSCDDALSPLIEYLDDNMSTLFQELNDVVSKMVFSQLWKEVLITFESLLVPPLSDKPSSLRPLNEFELKMTFDCLEVSLHQFGLANALHS